MPIFKQEFNSFWMYKSNSEFNKEPRWVRKVNDPAGQPFEERDLARVRIYEADSAQELDWLSTALNETLDCGLIDKEGRFWGTMGEVDSLVRQLEKRGVLSRGDLDQCVRVEYTHNSQENWNIKDGRALTEAQELTLIKSALDPYDPTNDYWDDEEPEFRDIHPNGYDDHPKPQVGTEPKGRLLAPEEVRQKLGLPAASTSSAPDTFEM